MNVRKMACAGILATLAGLASTASAQSVPGAAERTYNLGDTVVVRYGPAVNEAMRESIRQAVAGSLIGIVKGDTTVEHLRVAGDASAAVQTLLQIPGVVVDADLARDFVAEQMSVSSFEQARLALPAQAGQSFDVEVNLGGQVFDLALDPHSIRSANFQVLIDDGSGALQPAPAPASKTYRGEVVGQDSTIVAASLHDGLTAEVRFEGKDANAWYVQPVSAVLDTVDPTLHVVYSMADVVNAGRHCGGALRHLTDSSDAAGSTGSPGGSSERVFQICQIAFDADFEFYQKNGSNVNNTIADVENVLNGVTIVYERDCEVTFDLTTVIVRSNSSDPYTSSDPSTLLNQFRNHWQSSQGGIVRDIAHLMTGRNVNGGVIGIAWLSAVCTSNGYGLSESRFTTNYNQRVALTAHEIGHNFSADHCDSLGFACKIMCSGLGGCGGIGLPNFGTQEATGISNYAVGRPCLADGSSGNQPPTVGITSPMDDPFNTTVGSPVGLVGIADDDEDGSLNSSIEWSSNIQGALGTGQAVVVNLVAGTHVITAFVEDSDGDSSTDTTTIIVSSVSLPNAPGTPVITDSPTGLALTWADNSSNEEGFDVERQQKSGGSWTNSTIVVSTFANQNVAGDTPGSGGWRYHVRAFNAAGDSAYSSYTIAKPGRPAKPTAAPTGLNVAVAWDDPSSIETGFRVERQEKVSGVWTNTVTFDVGTNVENFNDVVPNTGTFRYRVRALNPGKIGQWSPRRSVNVN